MGVYAIMDGLLGGADNAIGNMIGLTKDAPMAPPGQHTMDPYDALTRVESVEITEKVSVLEAAAAAMGQEVEMPNKYSIMDESGKRIFFVVESTGFCARQCKQVAGDCAPWDV